MDDNLVEPEKPSDWPANNRETLLSLVDQFCDDFLKDSSYINKERLIALTTFDEPTRHASLGLIRFTDYEISLINGLYLKFKLLQFQYGIVFLYEILWQNAQQLKMANMLPMTTIKLPECFHGLIVQLRYFFYTSYFFFQEKQRSFADELINEIEIIEKANVVSSEEIVLIFNNVLYDLSSKCTNHWFQEFDFSRDEIKKLFVKAANLMKKASLKETDRPHRGILCMALSNFILRSRNNYRFDNVYKCVDKKTVDASFVNNELWMKKKSKLNDKREGKVVREIFSNRQWIKYSWAKNMKFTYERESFTCSFSTKPPSDRQKKKYGQYVYGFHNDTIGPSITTLISTESKKLKRKSAVFSQYIMYDVLYSRDEFKKEMNYLFSIIDTFSLTDEEKRYFLEEIIDYWKLTIKDRRWSYENERRYEIMHFPDYEYTECKIERDYLKNKTPLLLFPDFILGKNHMKEYLRHNIEQKAGFKNIGSSSMMCNECLFETSWLNGDRSCPICGSKNLTAINQKADR